MDFHRIKQDLEKGNYKPIYFLHGEESYFIDELLHELEHNVLTDAEKSFNQSVFYGKDADPQSVMDAARRLPMGSERQVVILKEAQDMRRFDELIGYVTHPVPTTILGIAYKNKKLDGRSKMAKLLKDKAVVLESKKIYDNQVPQWVMNFIKSKNYDITPEAALLVAEYLGQDLAKIVNELKKLILNLEVGSKINKSHIARHIGISKEYNIFEFQKALGFKEKDKAYRIQEYFSANTKSHPLILILASLYNYFSKVYMLHFLGRKPDKELVRALRLPSPYFLKEYKTSATNYSRTRSEEVLALLREYDLKGKGVNNVSTNDSELLKEMTFRILQ